MIMLTMLVVGALLAIIAPMILPRSNPGKMIPEQGNRRFASWAVTYASGVALAIAGAIFSSVPPIFCALLVVPLIAIFSVHNRKATRD